MEKIKKARLLKGYTQEEFGALLGYSAGHISHIEKGRRQLKLKDIKKIERYLNIHLLSDNVEEGKESKLDRIEKKLDKVLAYYNL